MYYVVNIVSWLDCTEFPCTLICFVGTTVGGNDVVAFHSVGVVNHAVLHGLFLQSGHTYYATVKGNI